MEGLDSPVNHEKNKLTIGIFGAGTRPHLKALVFNKQISSSTITLKVA